MANSNVDLSEIFKGLDKLSTSSNSLARSMLVAGGKAVRDEAKARVRVKDGILRDSIYLAYKNKESTKTLIHYAIACNEQKAPHAHLIEFGHWQPYKVKYNPRTGQFWTDKSEKLDKPQWTPAYPFLRPAFESLKSSLFNIMMERGKERFPEIIKGVDSGND